MCWNFSFIQSISFYIFRSVVEVILAVTFRFSFLFELISRHVSSVGSSKCFFCERNSAEAKSCLR